MKEILTMYAWLALLLWGFGVFDGEPDGSGSGSGGGGGGGF